MSTLDEIEALLAKATPGPWGTWGVEGDDETWERGVQGPLVFRGDGSCFNINVATVKAGGCEEADAALIAASRNALPELLALAREALRRREVFGLAKLVCQRSEQQGAHFYLVDLETMEALIAAVAEAQ